MVTYRIASGSRLEVTARSSLHPIHGWTEEIEGELIGEVRDGTVELEPAPRGAIEIPTRSLTSGNRIQDIEMHRRIETTRYPTIRLELVAAGGGPHEFEVTCRLTFHGVTRELAEQVSVRFEDGNLHASGRHRLDVRDYGISPPRILMMKVHPEVEVTARLAAVPG